MNTETPRTDALMPDQVHKRTMYEHILVMEAHARQLERELNEANRLQRNKMRTYRKIHILFADEEPAMSYADEAIAQTVLERCEEWQEKMSEIETGQSIVAVTPAEFCDKLQAHKDAHPLHPCYANAKDYSLSAVFLHE